MPTQSKTRYAKIEHEWVFKASWRATAIKVKLLARTYEEALVKVQRLVKKLEGGQDCMDIHFIEWRENKDVSTGLPSTVERAL